MTKLPHQGTGWPPHYRKGSNAVELGSITTAELERKARYWTVVARGAGTALALFAGWALGHYIPLP